MAPGVGDQYSHGMGYSRIPGIICISNLCHAIEILSMMGWRNFLSKYLSALLERAIICSTLVAGHSLNEFTSLFLTACYRQASVITKEAGIGYAGISISSFALRKKVLTTSCQVHQRLKRCSVDRFTFIWIVTLTGLSRMLAMNLYRNHPGSSNR